MQQSGAETDPIPHPSDPSTDFRLQLDLRAHAARIETSAGDSRSISLREGLSTTAFGERLLAEMEELGIAVEVDRQRFADDSPRSYDPEHAEAYRQALVSVNRVLLQHRRALPGETGPVQLWPHNFDLAFEWFGSRIVTQEEGGERKEYPAQLNFGFAPGDSSHPQPYFYSNPWPFADELTQHPLPNGARWHSEGWSGSLLPYRELVGPSADRLLAYYRAVYELASPRLTE